VASFSLLRVPLRCTVSFARGPQGCNPYLYGHATAASLAPCPSWRRRALLGGVASWVLTWLDSGGGWWCCLRATADEVCVGRKVQRNQGCLRSWVATHGAVMAPVTAGWMCCSPSSLRCLSLAEEWGSGRGEAPTQSGQDQWFSLALRWELYVEAPCPCVWLEGDGPLVEELELLLMLQRAATLDATQRWRQRRSCRVTSLGFSPSLLWCSVLLCVV
jgi:hypothetical protein